MTAAQDWVQVTDGDELTALIGTPSFRAANKDRWTLHPLDLQWLAASPFVLVGTSDAAAMSLRRVTRQGSSCT